MSINNRKLKEGTLHVLNESKFQRFLGKIYCSFAGHKEVKLKTNKGDFYYCICCWKELN